METKTDLNPMDRGERSGLLISEMILLTVFALVAVAAKQMMRLDLNLPGHSYILYIFFMVSGSCWVPKKGAALYMGIAAGIFAVTAGSRKGILDIFRYVVPALSLEGVRLLPVMGHPMVNRVMEGVILSLMMHVVKSGLNLITGKPFEVVLLKFYPGLVTYPAIGIFCGILAWYMNRAVRRYKGR